MRAPGAARGLVNFLRPRFHRTIFASSEVDRERLLSVLAGYAKEAAFLATLCASPTQILGRVGLGDAKRTQYQTQLDGAGPVELETAALTAVATNDLVLAAAIVTVLDRRPVDRRPFSANDLAARLFGAEYKKVSTQLAGIQLALKTATAANREFVRGKADPLICRSTCAANAGGWNFGERSATCSAAIKLPSRNIWRRGAMPASDSFLRRLRLLRRFQ